MIKLYNGFPKNARAILHNAARATVGRKQSPILSGKVFDIPKKAKYNLYSEIHYRIDDKREINEYI